MSNEDVCSGGTTLIFACSGAADVGAISDQAARQLTREKRGQMFCLAGIGGRVEPIMEKTKSAAGILAIDGCPVNCVKLCLEQAGIDTFRHIRVTDLGFEKGRAPVSAGSVETVVEAARNAI